MVIGKRLYSLILLCGFWVSCEATERLPWVGNYLEFEWRNTVRYQNYSDVASPYRLEHYASQDLFIETSLINAVYPSFAPELELVVARTSQQNWCVDCFRLSGRYMLSDDIAGDSISFTPGFTLTQDFQGSLHDISSFHHGRSEAEAFISVGKERACLENWVSRWWAVFGMGVAERGSPWIRTDFDVEARICELHLVRAFVHTLWGMGHQQLHADDFHGYGAIQHQSIDFGFRYTYLIDFVGEFAVGYSYRVHARNFPANAHNALMTVLYTFGL